MDYLACRFSVQKQTWQYIGNFLVVLYTLQFTVKISMSFSFTTWRTVKLALVH